MSGPAAPHFRLSATQGMGFMASSMLFFALSDALIKTLSAQLPIAQLLMIAAFGTTAVFLAICLWGGVSVFSRAYWGKKPISRALSEAGVTLFTGFALSRLDLSSFTALFQTAPFVIMLASAALFKTRLYARHFMAIAIGFIGVLLITKPDTGTLEPALLLVLGSVICVTYQDLLTQTMPDDLPTPLIGFQAFLAVSLVSTLLFLAQSSAPSLPIDGAMNALTLALLLLLAGAFAGAYLCLVHATRHSDLSRISIMRYVRLGFALFIGVIYFGERPDVWAWAGIGLIALSGLGLFFWEKRLETRQT